MKKRSGCLKRILIIGMILGIIGAAGLGWMGYEKANTAEANATPIEELGTVYIGDAAIEADTALWEDLLAKVSGNSEAMESITAALGDKTIAEMIAVNCYLPDNDTVSTAIAQKIITHRLSQAYSNEELLFLYQAMTNDPALTAKEPSTTPETDLLADILTYLVENKVIKEDTAKEIKELTK